MAGQIIARGRNIWMVRTFMGYDAAGKRAYQNKTIHGTKKDAESYLSESLRQRDLLGTEYAALRTYMRELFSDLLTDYAVNEKGLKWAEQKVNLHLKKAFGDLQVRHLTTTMIRDYTRQRQKGGAANATINRELALLKRALNLGRKHTPAKVARVPHIPMLEENNVRKGFFEHDEYMRLLDALPAVYRPILTFGYYTGCRRGEILALTWDQVDLKERIARLDPGTTKNDQPRILPLTAELTVVLSEQKAQRDSDYPECDFVFADCGTQIRSFRGSWETSCFEAGLWVGDEKTGKPTRLFHDLRRTGVRNLIRAGVPERVAMVISGHKTRSVFDRYNIVSESDLRDAAGRLDSYIAQRSSMIDSKTKDSHTIRTPKRSLGNK
jgi:integrase